MEEVHTFSHPDAGKALVDTINALRDANISRDPNIVRDEEVVGGIKTKLTNSASGSKNDEHNIKNEYVEGLKKAFDELRSDEAAGKAHYV